MRIIEGNALKARRNKWRRIGDGKTEAGRSFCEELSRWVSCWWPFSVHDQKDGNVPSDVPKGHVAVYVGEEHKRYVIKITLLKHTLFQALLEQAHDCAYDLATEPKLCVPCHEYVFLEAVRGCTDLHEHGRLVMCR
ncbi:unnamed protein product [Rhodiola kirilowii]